MKRLYVRCNGGHYFLAGSSCPFDGWTMDGVARVAAHVLVLQARGHELSLDTIKEALPSDELLARLLVVEFGSDAAVFEALAPERYIHQGREVLADELDDSLR